MLLRIITIELAQYSSQGMNYYAMVDFVQRITHVHLEQTKITHVHLEQTKI